MQAMLVIDTDFFSVHDLLEGVEPLLCAEAVVRFALFDEHFCVFHIQSALYPFGLHVRTDRTAKFRAFIRYEAGLLHGMLDDFNRAFHLPFLICVFYAENKISAFMLRDQVCVKRGS